MRNIKIILAVLVLITGNIKADEGMWLLPLIDKLNIEKMHDLGCKLTADEIFSINQSSIKDAVVIFGGGCTGEIISDKGLILTNHHCGYGQIQSLSSMEHNYLEDGFWAATFDDEIPAPGLTVSFLKRMEDVTAQILNDVTDNMTREERQNKINANRTKLIKEVQGDTKYKIEVKDYFAGNQYFLAVYEIFKDIRFVGAPPTSIGKFGSETDNWMWPRQTGDFSMFRIYADPNGNPAEYSVNNVPYKPAKHLSISLKGYEKNDFGMTVGFPGSTFRYLTSWGIDERVNISNYARIKVRGEKQKIWSEAMNSSPQVRLQYANKYASSSNYWKNSIGMNKGIKDLDVVNKKRLIEKDFEIFAKNNSEFANVLTSLKSAYEKRAEPYLALIFLSETLINGAEILRFSTNATDLEDALIKKDTEKINKSIEKLKEAAKLFFKDYNAPTDEKVLEAMLGLYANELNKSNYPSFYQDIEKKFKGNYNSFSKNIFSKSIFANQNKLNAFLEKPNLKMLQSDPAFVAGKSAIEKSKQLAEIITESNNEITAYNRLFIKGLMMMNPNKSFYPDANFTMRLSYGTVGNYEPRDGVVYKHFTTLKGVIEKEDPDNYEFVVPKRLKELYYAKDYGQYAASDGDMHVCFTTNNDITGGNSGSPVINAKGELFGLAFDGNWEAMSGDIAFEPDLQKCINVDIRYVLFIIDKFAGAKNLIEEMTIN